MIVVSVASGTSADGLDVGVVDLHLAVELPWVDVLATLVELTAVTVADAVLPHAPTEVVASGGGTANPTLVAALIRRLGSTRLLLSDELGLPPPATTAPTRLMVQTAALPAGGRPVA